MLTGLLAAAPAAGAADMIFWANFTGSKISYANLDGTGGGGDLNTTGATAPNQVAGVAIDSAANRIYWANVGAGQISYANLDGTGGGDLNTSGATVGAVRGLAIDPAAGRLYWGNTSGTGIFYANLNGSGGGSLSTSGATVSFPAGVAIDPAANRIYWANFDLASTNKISYANLDGTGAGGDLVTTGATVAQPRGVAIDKAAGRIYWTNPAAGSTGKISYANLDGSGGGGNLDITGASAGNTSGPSLDPSGNRIYWATSDLNKVSFANLDGTGGGGSLNTSGATNNEPFFTAILRAPSPSGAPTITGGSQTGAVLSCSQGAWAADLLGAFLYRAPHSFAFQWSRDGTDIGGATSSSITADSPGEYRCRVTAQNAAGSAPQTSAAYTVSAPSSSTTTTLPAGCGPRAPTFVNIDCRLDELVAAVQAADLGRLKSGLSGAVGKARDKKKQAEQQSAAGRTKQGKNALRKAIRKMGSFVQKLHGRSGRTIIPAETAMALAGVATPIQSDMKALLQTL